MKERYGNLTESIEAILSQKLLQDGFEVIDVLPLLSQGDGVSRAKTVEQIIGDFDRHDSAEADGIRNYIVQLRPSKEKASIPSVQGEPIYEADGRPNVPFLLQNAWVLYDSSDFALAQNIYKTILSTFPGNRDALYGMARCFENEGKIDDAIRYFDESIAFEPSLDAYQRLAGLLMQKNRHQEAAEAFERALHLGHLPPKIQFELHQACGNCYTRSVDATGASSSNENLHKIKRDNQLKALNHYNQALVIESNSVAIRLNIALLHLKLENWTDSKACFEEVLKREPDNAKAYYGIGSIEYSNANKARAFDLFLRSAELDRSNLVTLYQLIKCAYDTKRYAPVEKLLAEFVEREPVSANLVYSLAGLQFQLGKYAEATSSAKKVLDLSQNHKGAQSLLRVISTKR